MQTKSQNLTRRGIAVAAIGAGILLALPAPRAQAQVANTLAFFDFNDGTAKDNSGNGNNGTAGGGAPTATSAGYQAGGYQFSAADNSGHGDNFTANVNLNPGTNPELTFGGWFYVTGALNPQEGLISNDTGNYRPTLDIDTRGGPGTTWSAFTGSGVLSSGVTAAAGQWTFVAAVYDQANSKVTLYVDPSGNGSGLVTTSATTSYASSLSAGATSVTVGRNPGFDNPFNGDMDNIFFVGSALTPTQIQNIDTKGQAAFLGSASAPEPSSVALGLVGGLSVVGLIAGRRLRKFSRRDKGQMDASCFQPLAFHTATSMGRHAL